MDAERSRKSQPITPHIPFVEGFDLLQVLDEHSADQKGV
jgi:hypothetical protein